MASVPGSHYNVFAGNQTVHFGVTSDPNNVPAPISGNFNLEVITNASGTGSFSTASGYQGLAILSADGHTFTALHGDYGVVDTGGNDSIFAGDGNIAIGGAVGDTITGGTGATQFLDAHLGHQLVIGGGAGNATIWGGTGDTIMGGAGNVTIGGAFGDTIIGGTGNWFIAANSGANQSVVGGSAGNGTIWGGAGDTIQGGAGNVTIGGAAGDTITGGTGTWFIDGHLGNQSIVGGSSGNGTIWGGGGDTIQGGVGNVTIGGVAGDTITGGTGTWFIDGDKGNQSIVGGSAGNGTIWGGAGDTIRGGAGNVTIGGVAGDTIIGGSGNAFIDADLGNQSVLGGSSGNQTIWGGSGDTIQGALTGGSATIAFGASHSNEVYWDDGLTSAGNDTVFNFSQASGDQVSINHATDVAATVAANATTDGSGNVVLHFSDGSNVTFIGITSVGQLTIITH